MKMQFVQRLWNNLFSWGEFGFELATGDDTNQFRDTWLIELTGGPNTECDTCPNYDMDDLADYYWPALISGVEAYSGEDEIDYVGFSNGCRTALESLENYQSSGKQNAGYYVNDEGQWELTDLSPNVVSTFIGVACPGAFEGNSFTKIILQTRGDEGIQKLESVGITHITSSQAIRSAVPTLDVSRVSTEKTPKISENLLSDYINFASISSDSQPGQGVVVDKLAIISGYMPLIAPAEDFVVTERDSEEIYDAVTSNDKKRMHVISTHSGQPFGPSITESSTAKRLIKKTLNNEEFTAVEELFNILESS